MLELNSKSTPGNSISPTGANGSPPPKPGPGQGLVFPEGAEPADNSPTIISKASPIQAGTPHQSNESFSGSLRGRTLAHFELIEPIGVGGMAAVIRARDKQLDRFVALKILPPEMAADQENVRRFHQEARAAAKLDHENIARVFFCGEDQRLHFIAFEFVEGDNLRTILERRGRLPVAETIRYVLQIAAGLEHASSRGVVHRDIKPSNIIVTPTGRAKLVDMGLARSLSPQDNQALTQSGVTLGTFDYISPEQALEPREADARSDIYSLGCTLYHMLTGQPPVPEGTAAKKLHHHQHVAPVDPRQLNADIPDEVAAILVRMMAKDPKDRYQRPVHLVQHLLQVAHKVGAGANVPEGVMFVDAPLPNAPRQRPLLMISLAAMALGLLLFLLSLAPTGPTPAPKKPNGPNGPYVVKVPKDKGDPKGPSGDPSFKPVRGPHEVRTEEDLAEMLRDPKTTQVVIAGSKLDLSGNLPAIQATGRHLLIQGPENERKTINVKYQEEDREWFAGLTIVGGTVEFKYLRFVVESEVTPEKTMVASVALSRGARVKFTKCLFYQLVPEHENLIKDRGRKIPVASVVVDNVVDEEKTYAEFHECEFHGDFLKGQRGQVAIAVSGPAQVLTTDCAFFPHSTVFHLRGPSQEAAFMVKRCAAFTVHGPLLRVDDEAGGSFDLEHSIISCPEPIIASHAYQDLIHQTSNRKPAVAFTGRHNYYHNLNALWVLESRLVTDLVDCQALAKQAGGDGDSTSFSSKEISPWDNKLPHHTSNRSAFIVDPLLPQVRRPVELGRDPASAPALGPNWANASLKPLPRPKLKENEIVVDAEADDNTPGHYRDMDLACAHAKKGTVIYIKHPKGNRVVKVHPVRFDKGEIDVTLKPWSREHQPILMLAKTPEKDSALFRLKDGKICLEDLEVQLESPKQSGFKGRAMVLIEGNGQCTFKHCVLTLKEAGGIPREIGFGLSVITLGDPEDSMMMENEPRKMVDIPILIQDCFVRGEGDLVSARASRALRLEVDNSLVVLNGSILDLTSNAKDMSPDHPGVRLKLTKVAAFVEEPLILLKAGKSGKGLAPTRMETAQRCLFTALGNRPFIYLDGPELNENKMRDFFDWKGDHNAYWGFDRFLDQPRFEDGMRLQENDWRTKYESDLKILQGKFPMLEGSRPLSGSLPDHFKGEADFGPDFNLLPKPGPLKKAEPAETPAPEVSRTGYPDRSLVQFKETAPRPSGSGAARLSPLPARRGSDFLI